MPTTLNKLVFSDEVKQALENHLPLLALESTIITHGMPYPANVETAKEVEAIVRNEGVTPATIAIMNGQIKIGLSVTELEALAQDTAAMKVSTRDIAFALQEHKNAGTTVAATMFCAHLAGIKLFATGGIGGVHRGDDMDISADLLALANIPVAVICAGAKAILDLPKTLEYLDTHSVPVIGFKTSVLPAFYTRASQYLVQHSIDNISTLAEYLKTQWQLTSSTGVLITNPIPAEDEIPAHLIEPAILQALQLAKEKNIVGKAITPFLLKQVSEITQGKSLIANKSLIKNNVLLGAQLARKMAEVT